MAKAFKPIVQNDNLWKGLGTQYTSFSQCAYELVDNAISNFKGKKGFTNSVIITVEEFDEKSVKFSVEDSGTGIEDFANALGIGSHKCVCSPLNEHGFGLKQALAAANPQNDAWRICTRTDLSKQYFEEVRSPYHFDQEMSIDDSKSNATWPGNMNSTGTYIECITSRDFFETVKRGLRGEFIKFETLAALLYEDLAFTYSKVIMYLGISIKLIVKTKEKTEMYDVGALLPDVQNVCGPGSGDQKVTYDGKKKEYVKSRNGKMNIHYEFLQIHRKPFSMNFDSTSSRRYYKTNMSSSGVEIRFNGRCMKYNVFSDIWATEKHNSYNALLVIIDLQTDDPDMLPKTTTSKNGFNEGDEKLEALYSWIRKMMPNPEKKIMDSTNEKELLKRLKMVIESGHNHTNAKPTASLEQRVWHCISDDERRIPRIDLYEYTADQDINIYEGKAHKSDSMDVYQLKMYWDGAVNDGIVPTKGILVAHEHPEWVENLIEHINKMKDVTGRSYNLETDTWTRLRVNENRIAEE